MSSRDVNTAIPRWNTPLPIIQAPKPIQPYPDGKYERLLDNTQLEELPASSGSSSTGRSSLDASPSSTLCSHRLGGQDVSKFFMDPHFLQNIAPPLSTFQHYDQPSTPFDFKTHSAAAFSSRQSESEPLSMSAVSQPPDNSEGRKPACRPPRPLKTNPYMKLKKSWDHIFQAGCKALGPIQRAIYAKKLVWRGAWDNDAILDLVRVFIWRASDFEAPEPINFVAFFAAEVSNTFMQQQMPDERFKYVLREALMNTIMGCWHVPRDAYGDPLPTQGHRPVTLDRNPTIDYKWHAHQAVMLYGFVGCLYKHSQLPRADIARCVRVIFMNAKVAEHLHALELILTGAGPKLWKESVDLTTEVQHITTEIKKLKHKIMDAWVLYLPHGRTKEKIEQLIALVENFSAEVFSGERAAAQLQHCCL